jgi:hypothetical protein
MKLMSYTHKFRLFPISLLIVFKLLVQRVKLGLRLSDRAVVAVRRANIGNVATEAVHFDDEWMTNVPDGSMKGVALQQVEEEFGVVSRGSGVIDVEARRKGVWVKKSSRVQLRALSTVQWDNEGKLAPGNCRWR